jgi:hypothetical protein
MDFLSLDSLIWLDYFPTRPVTTRRKGNNYAGITKNGSNQVNIWEKLGSRRLGYA